MPDAAATAPQAAGTATQTGGAVDPYRAYAFKLEIQGVTQAHFTECNGLGIKVHPIRYREGGTAPQVVRVLPGPVEYADIVLRYGLTASHELWDWFMAAVRGQVERKNVSILLLDSDGVTEVMRWNLINAWPAEWQGTILNAMAREVAIESLTLVYESLERG
jgi:phage tail-like protein